MAFPVVEATNTSIESADTTSHDVALPASIASGDVVIIIIVLNGATGAPPITGWDRLLHFADGSANFRIAVFTRTADGTEGSTQTVTTNGSVESAHATYRISGSSGTVEVSTGAEAPNSSHPDPDSLTPSGGSDDYLWLAIAGHEGDRTFSAAPANYSSLLTADSSGAIDAVVVGTAHRALAASSEDPGAFTLSSTSTLWLAATLAVFPEAAAGPAAPSGLTATLSAVDEIDLAWTDNSTTETGFEIERDSGSGFTLIHTTAADATSFTDIGLDPSTTYTYRVRATDGSNESAYSNTDSAVTAPAAPTAVTASNPSDTTVDVAWADQTGGAMQHRVFWRETGSGDPWMVFSTLPAGTTSETVTGLTAGTAYDIGVASYDSANDLESAIVFDTATTTGGSGSLTPPSDLAVTGFSATSVSLSWTDTTGGFFKHRVYYRTPPTSGTYVLFSTLANEFNTETVTGLDPNTNYEFGVASWDGVDESAKAEITQMTATARWVDGAHMLGVQGDTVIESEEGAITQGTGADDGAGAKTLPKGVRSGSVAHLGVVEFAEPYDSVPLVVYAGGGLSMEQRALWGTKAAVDAGTASDAAPTTNAIYQEPVFEVDTTGFTALLRLRTNAATVAESAAIGSPTTLTAVGTTGEATPSNADLPAFDDTYSVSYSGSLETNKGGPASITVTLEARLNGGSWTEIASGQHVTTFPSGGGLHDFGGQLVGVISGMDGSGLDQFRCRVKSLTLSGSAPSASVTFQAVQWSTSSPDYASMTPESGDEASFVVIGNTGSA